MKYYWIFWSCLWSSVALAQELDTVSYNVYFDTDSYSPSSQQLEGLTNFLDRTTVVGTLQYLTIEGHTDRRASEAYNLTLSKNRAAALEAYLTQYYQNKNKAVPLIKVAFYGEQQPSIANATADQLGKNRRVVLHWVVKGFAPVLPPPPVVEESISVGEEPVVVEEQQDSPVVLHVRDYLFYMPSQEEADEARIKVIKTGREAYNEGLTTVDTEGGLLNSSGMFRVCGSPELEFIKVRIPVIDTTAAAPDYYTRVGERWPLTTRPVTKVKDENTGQWYYELKAENCTWINADVYIDPMGIIVRVPINPFWVKKMHLLNDNPIQNYPLRARELKVHAASGFAPSPPYIEGSGTATDSNRVVAIEMLGQSSGKAKLVMQGKLIPKRKLVAFPMLVLKEERHKELLAKGHDGYVRVNRLASLFVKTYPLKHVIYRIRPKDWQAARKVLRQQLKEQKVEVVEGAVGGL